MNKSCNEIIKHRQPSPSWYKAAKAIAPFLLFVLLIFNALTVVAISSKTYVGNKSTKVYHMSTCTYSEKISSANRVYFSSRSEAEQNGYRRCYYCGDDVIGSGQNSGSSSGAANSIRNPSTNKGDTNTIQTPTVKQSNQRNDSRLSFFFLILGCYLLAAFLFLPAAYLCDRLRENNHRDLADLLNGIPLTLWFISLPLSEFLRRKLESRLAKKHATQKSTQILTEKQTQNTISSSADPGYMGAEICPRETMRQHSELALSKEIADYLSLSQQQSDSLREFVAIFALKVYRTNALTINDIDNFIDHLYASGFIIPSYNQYRALGMNVILTQKIYIPVEECAKLEDWHELEQRAIAAGILFTNNSNAPDIEAWIKELSVFYPGFDDPDLSLEFLCERIVQFAEDAFYERESLPEFIAGIAELPHTREQEFISATDKHIEQLLRKFAQNIGAIAEQAPNDHRERVNRILRRQDPFVTIFAHRVRRLIDSDIACIPSERSHHEEKANKDTHGPAAPFR